MSLPIIIAIAVAVIVSIALTMRPSGPRVTTIETRRTDSDEAEK